MIENKKNMTLKEIFIFFWDLILIILVIFIFTKYILWPSQIYGNSMDSNFYTDEYILVNRISYIDFPFI
jgi:signal peptidase I